MAVGFSAVNEHTIACVQLIGLPLVGKFTFARQNDETQERHQILSEIYAGEQETQERRPPFLCEERKIKLLPVV